MQTYPEDSGTLLGEACQADKWYREVDGALAAPMARSATGKDYYVEEPCLVSEGDAVTPVMPVRWFRRGHVLWAKAHRLLPDLASGGFAIDGRGASCVNIPLSAFFLNVLDLEKEHCQHRYGIPPPKILGKVIHLCDDQRTYYCRASLGILVSDDTRTPLEHWSHPNKNAWQEKANGRRVMSVPLWVYCDDTSGNTSKKWNKHNSFLFTLAGLPQEYVHMLYNIHFVATSNIASPLEMAEYILEALR